MKNTEAVAQSFEKTAAELEKEMQRDPRAISLKAALRMRADQVRVGQEELDRAKEILKEAAS